MRGKGEPEYAGLDPEQIHGIMMFICNTPERMMNYLWILYKENSPLLDRAISEAQEMLDERSK